jgi:uncharacterized protein YbaR (Trm112 family)
MLVTVAAVPTDLLGCPACRGRLEDRSGGLACLSCDRIYPLFDGVANLLLEPPESRKSPDLLVVGA